MLKEFSKMCLFLVLFVYLDIAVVLIYMGVRLLTSYQDAKGLTTGDCENCAIKLISILVAVGVVAITFTLIGCTGVCRDKTGVLRGFLALFFVLLLLEIAGGTVAFYQRHKLGSIVQQRMNSTFGKYNTGGAIKIAIDHLQQKIGKDSCICSRLFTTVISMETCCGVNNPSDWSHYGFNMSSGPLQLPESCCSSSHSGVCTTTNIDSFEMGCYVKICNVYNENKPLILSLTGSFFFIQVVGLLFGLYLSCTTKTITSEERRLLN